MNLRLLLPVLAALVLLVGVAAWWRMDAETGNVGPVALDDFADRSTRPGELEPGTSAISSPTASGDARAPIAPSSAVNAAEPAGDSRPRPTRIVGKVTSAVDGKPVAGASVRMTSPASHTAGFTEGTGSSDLNGEYDLPPLGPGDWILTCEAHGFARQQFAFVLSPGGVIFKHDFVLQRESPEMVLAVRLRGPDAQPIRGSLSGPDLEIAMLLRPVIVTECPARGIDLPARSGVIKSRAQGVRVERSDEWFRVTLAPVTSACCCLMLGDRVLDAVPFGAGSTSVLLVVSPEDLQRVTGTLQLTVVDDATGEPFAGARVNVRPLAGAVRSVVTDATAKVVLDRLMAGEAGIEVSAKGRTTARKQVSIAPGTETDAGEIRLSRSVIISGRIDLPPAGLDPAPFVMVSLYRVVNGIPDIRSQQLALRDTGLNRPPTLIDERGAFAFENLDADTYIVGWKNPLDTSAPPTLHRGETPGWVQADARFGDVRGLHIAVTEAMWSSARPPAKPR